jgi:hypothetical protein
MCAGICSDCVQRFRQQGTCRMEPARRGEFRGNLGIEWQKGRKQGFESYFCQLLFERDSTVMYDGDKKEVEIMLTQEISFSRRGGLKQFTLQSVAEILYLVIL